MSCSTVSSPAQIPMETKDYIESVLKLGEESVNRGDRVTHCCISCRIESPRQRVAATACGHAVCRKCAHESKTCPECAVPTTFVSIIGDEDRRRECGVCLVDQPYERVFFSACGHSICSCCVLQLDEDNLRANLPIDCPFCRCKSTIVSLVEEVIEAVDIPAIDRCSQKKSSSRKRSRMNHHDSNTSNKRQRRD